MSAKSGRQEALLQRLVSGLLAAVVMLAIPAGALVLFFWSTSVGSAVSDIGTMSQRFQTDYNTDRKELLPVAMSNPSAANTMSAQLQSSATPPQAASSTSSNGPTSLEPTSATSTPSAVKKTSSRRASAVYSRFQ